MLLQAKTWLGAYDFMIFREKNVPHRAYDSGWDT